MPLYYIDDDELRVLKRVTSRLSDEMKELTADDRRDLATAIDAVLHHIETYGLVDVDEGEG